jgi:hypothetical protein
VFVGAFRGDCDVLVPHTRVACTLPPGRLLNLPLLLQQRGGEFASSPLPTVRIPCAADRLPMVAIFRSRLKNALQATKTTALI